MFITTRLGTCCLRIYFLLLHLSSVVDFETLLTFLFGVMQVFDDTPDSNAHEIRSRLTSDEPDLSSEERAKIRQFLESFADEVHED